VSELVQIGSQLSTASTSPSKPDLSSSVLWLQSITVAWMLIEFGVSAFAAWTARSPAILAFGVDSFVEVLSATVVLLQFAPFFAISEYKAARASGVLLFLLAFVVADVAVVTLVLRIHPEVSRAGIGITIAALIAMPILAKLKRREARRRQVSRVMRRFTSHGLTLSLHWLQSPSSSKKDGQRGRDTLAAAARFSRPRRK
jgi:divalent metal cation (Fe/Co/Zn/Cd) transporter